MQIVRVEESPARYRRGLLAFRPKEVYSPVPKPMPRQPWPPIARLVTTAQGTDLEAVEPDGAMEVYPGLFTSDAEVFRFLGIDAGATDDEILALLLDRAEARCPRSAPDPEDEEDGFGGWAA